MEYTEQQCQVYNIPTRQVPSGKLWNPVNSSWDNKYVDLPVYKNLGVILVPKAIVRYTLEYDHQKYYNHFVLEYLQEEHLNANTALVRLLKNGKRRVYKKDLKDDPRYKLTKEFLYKFSKKHPEVLKRYVESLPENICSLTNEQIEGKHEVSKDFGYAELKRKLTQVKPGKKEAQEYHNVIIGVLEAIFYPSLFAPEKEERIHKGRKRIDITYQNAADSGFFGYISKHVPCPFILCECKNYTEDPENPEVDQLAGRFSPRRGKFGLLICRKVTDKSLMTQRCRDTANDERGYIIILDDHDLIKLLDFKETGNEKAIESFFTDKYKELIM